MNQKLLSAVLGWGNRTADYARWWRKYTWVWRLSGNEHGRCVLWVSCSVRSGPYPYSTGFSSNSFDHAVRAATSLAVGLNPKRHVDFYSVRASMPTSVVNDLLAAYVEWLLAEEEE